MVGMISHTKSRILSLVVLWSRRTRSKEAISILQALAQINDLFTLGNIFV
jgi:hypothetical protein